MIAVRASAAALLTAGARLICACAARGGRGEPGAPTPVVAPALAPEVTGAQPDRATVATVLDGEIAAGRVVRITGRCLGYGPGPGGAGFAAGPPPRTRSDWLLADGTRAIYVVGAFPTGCGPLGGGVDGVTVTGRVAVDTLPGMGRGTPTPRRYLVRTAAARVATDTLPHAQSPGAIDLAPLDAFVRERAAADSFSGVVLVAHGERPLLARAYGEADRVHHVPNAVDTRFNLASLGKSFTAISILQLATRGAVRLDATVGTYLPDFPNAAVRDSVTVHQLLTHTSGLGSYFSPAYFERHERLRTTADFVPLFAAEPLQFAPGTRFLYSNAGYIVLGLIIERVTGQSYAEYVAAHVFKPAGMTASGFDRGARARPLAVGYTTQTPTGPSPVRIANDAALAAAGGPAGGGYATAGDLARFARALLTYRLLDSAHTALAITGKVAMPTPGLRYGYGFGEQRVGASRTIGHNGGFIGANTELRILPESGYTVVILSNYDPPAAEVVAQRAIALLTGAAP